jgi:hypothetical protein
LQGVSLSELIHQHVRAAIETAVARGLQAPVLAIIDGNAGLRRAVGLVRAHMEQALSGRRHESARRRRRVPHVLSLPQNAVENAMHHEHD